VTAPGAVVLGGDYRGLGIVRSLGRRGIPVWVVHGADTVARYSRYCLRSVPWRAPLDEAWIEFVYELAEKNDLHGWALFPTSDEAAWLVSRHWDKLSARYRLTTPRWEVYSAAADKAAVATLAGELGLGTPRTWRPRSVADLDEIDDHYPVVVKPARREHDNPLTVAKAWRADDRATLHARYLDARDIVPADEIIVQEWVPGGGSSQYAFGAVCVAGDPRVSIVARRTRQYPRDFGRASCFVESVDHPVVAKEAIRLLQALRIDGLAEVEFKQDEADGSLKLLDVNVRVWGWHSLGAAAGVDFSHAAYRMACGEELEYRVGAAGVRWARLALDVPYALADFAGGRLRASEYLRSLRRPLQGPIAARDDPLPAVAELPLLLLQSAWRPRLSRSTHRKTVRRSDPSGQEATCRCVTEGSPPAFIGTAVRCSSPDCSPPSCPP
jgi:predicted ATP-grasp superfamily ATP-dependent carboligase